ncbi:hypothetical protein V1280_009278 [Bradyrhizobium sp. AZCC 2230]
MRMWDVRSAERQGRGWQSSPTFNLSLENAIRSMSHDARGDCARQVSMVRACPSVQTSSTPRSIPGAHWDCELLPHEPMELPWTSCAWLARVDARQRPVEHPASPPRRPVGRGQVDPSCHRADARPSRGPAPHRWMGKKMSAGWYPGRPSPAICARMQSGWRPRRCCSADRKTCPAAPAKTSRLSAEERRVRRRRPQDILPWAKPMAAAVSAISIDP